MPEDAAMSRRVRAASVHVLTAIGAVLALLALRAAHQADWQMMFVWLGVALVVDTVDGPLARLFDVKTVLPRFSGERLDLIVDYLTYVAIPAFVLTETDLLPELFRLPAAIAILLSGLFPDNRMAMAAGSRKSSGRRSVSVSTKAGMAT